MLEGFIEYSNDLGGSYAGSWSKISNLNSQLSQQKQEYEEKIHQLEEKQKQLEMQLEESEEETWMEREEAEKALDKAKEWRERQLGEINAKHRLEVSEFLGEIESLQNNLKAKQEELD